MNNMIIVRYTDKEWCFSETADCYRKFRAGSGKFELESGGSDIL